MEITFLGLFLILTFIGSIILFYAEHNRRDNEGKRIGDFYYQLFYFLFSIFTFSFLIFYSFLMIGMDFNLGFDHDILVLNDMSLNNLNFTGNQNITNNTQFFVFNFENINSDKQGSVMNSDFCFWYNNTDTSPNVIRVTEGVNEISDYVYLNNNTNGFTCTSINNSFVKQNVLLGVICLDCSVSNPLLLPEAQVIKPINKVSITKNDPTNYVVERNLFAPVFWVKTNNNVGWIIKQIFFRIYLLGLGAFILAFGFRWGYKYVSEDYDEYFSK